MPTVWATVIPPVALAIATTSVLYAQRVTLVLYACQVSFALHTLRARGIWTTLNVDAAPSRLHIASGLTSQLLIEVQSKIALDWTAI